MAIRVEHSPSGAAAGMAAYAAGVGKAKERQKKYALDLYQEDKKFQQQAQLQFQGFRYQDYLQQQQQEALKARQRKEIEFRQEEGRLDRESSEKGRQAQIDFYKERDRVQFAREDAKDSVRTLPEIPEGADAGERKKLFGIKRSMEELARSKKWDIGSDPAAQKMLSDMKRDYEDIVAGIETRRPGMDKIVQEANEGVGILENGRFREAKPGEKPNIRWDSESKSYQPIPMTQEEMLKYKEAEETKLAKQKETEAQQKRAFEMDREKRKVMSSLEYIKASPADKKAMLAPFEDTGGSEGPTFDAGGELVGDQPPAQATAQATAQAPAQAPTQAPTAQAPAQAPAQATAQAPSAPGPAQHSAGEPSNPNVGPSQHSDDPTALGTGVSTSNEPLIDEKTSAPIPPPQDAKKAMDTGVKTLEFAGAGASAVAGWFSDAVKAAREERDRREANISAARGFRESVKKGRQPHVQADAERKREERRKRMGR